MQGGEKLTNNSIKLFDSREQLTDEKNRRFVFSDGGKAAARRIIGQVPFIEKFRRE